MHRRWRRRANGDDVQGPLPPDTAFLPPRRQATDAFVCMYHDQGLIPLKALAFDTAVNVTLGLPIIRTSVDHGTALDIAWTGRAKRAAWFKPSCWPRRSGGRQSGPPGSGGNPRHPPHPRGGFSVVRQGSGGERALPPPGRRSSISTVSLRPQPPRRLVNESCQRDHNCTLPPLPQPAAAGGRRGERNGEDLVLDLADKTRSPSRQAGLGAQG